MDQIFTVVLSEKVNERTYTLTLPIGAPWAEAIDIAKFFAGAVEQLAKDAEKQAAERAAAQEPIDAVVEESSEDSPEESAKEA